MDQSPCRTRSCDLSIKIFCHFNFKEGMTSWGWWRVLKGPRVTLGCGPLTLTLEPCYPFSNPKGSYIWRRTWSLVLVVSQKIREGACALKKLGFWGVNGAFPGPWPPGEVGAGSRSPRTVSLVVTWVFSREFKKNNKINACFFWHRFQTEVYSVPG